MRPAIAVTSAAYSKAWDILHSFLFELIPVLEEGIGCGGVLFVPFELDVFFVPLVSLDGDEAQARVIPHLAASLSASGTALRGAC